MRVQSLADARAIVERQPTPESEQRSDTLAKRAKKAKNATFLVRYRTHTTA